MNLSLTLGLAVALSFGLVLLVSFHANCKHRAITLQLTRRTLLYLPPHRPHLPNVIQKLGSVHTLVGDNNNIIL